MFTLEDLLGFIWTLPNSIVGWIFLLILYVCKQVEDVEVCRGLVFVWDIDNNSWFYKKALRGQGWGGFAIGNNVVLMDRYPIEKYGRSYMHEREHVLQAFKWGPLFYPIYILESIRIFLFFRDLHSYYDNTFEVEARLAAGQEVSIPKEQWGDPGDRWIWW
jgi:hypothetical protein